MREPTHKLRDMRRRRDRDILRALAAFRAEHKHVLVPSGYIQRLPADHDDPDGVERDYPLGEKVSSMEVENALTNLSKRKQQTEELSSRRQKLVTVSKQVYAQLEEGMVTQLEVFEVERSLLDAEQQMPPVFN